MSSSDSDSSDSSSNCSTGWPWQVCGCRHADDSDESDSLDDNSSNESSQAEETTDDSWTNKKTIFISVFSDNLKNATLITNYHELHNYRDKYAKLSKKSADNIRNIWREVKVNIPNTGIIPLESYEKNLIVGTKNKNKAVKKPTIVSKKIKTQTNTTQSPEIHSSKATLKPVTSNQINLKVVTKTVNKTEANATKVASKNTKENSSNVKSKNKENESSQKKIAEAAIKVAKSTEENKTTVSGTTKVDKKDKGVKVDIVVLNVSKSGSDKKNLKTQSTNASKLNECYKNKKSKSSELEFKKPQIKTGSSKNKAGKNNSKVVAIKSKKKKSKRSRSQSSESSDPNNRSSSVDSCIKAQAKERAKKRIEKSDNDTTDDEDEDEIIDNMDVLTGNAEVAHDEMFELVKHKDNKKVEKTVDTPIKAEDKKVDLKNNDEQSTPVSSPKNDPNPSLSEKNYVFYSEKFAEDSIDMMLENNLMGGLESLVEAMEFNPGDDRHYLNRCYCYLRLNRPTLALADAQYVLQTSSHYGHRFIAYLRAGQASMSLQKYTQAENFFKDSLHINSGNMYALRELMRAKISRIVCLGYTERNAVLALLKYSKTQEAINYLAHRNFTTNENNTDNDERNFDDTNDLEDLVYSSDEDEKPNCTSLINNMTNYEPIVTKLFHLLAKPVNSLTSTLVPSNKNINVDNKKKNPPNSKTVTGQVMDKTVWVGSLPRSMTDAALKKHFKQFGNIISVYCPPNEAYAFVNFEKSEHVVNVLKNPSAHEVNGARLVVRQGVHKK